MSSSNSSRVWFITGTSSGLGKALTEAVLVAGERVVATLRKPSALAYLQEKYSDSQLLVHRLDVSNLEEIKAAVAAAVSHFGTIDVVVNNAGYAIFGEAEATSDEDARKLFDVQFSGAVNIMKETVKIFRENKTGGRFFNVSTAGGYSANPAISFYNSSKFALEGFTQAFLKEMSPEWNISGCIIEPGGFNSEWSSGSALAVPLHPAYDSPSNPSFHMREYRKTLKFGSLGSAEKMGLALYKLADEKELPLRIQFESEGLFLVRSQALRTAEDAERWDHVAHSTNADGKSGKEYVINRLLASGMFEGGRYWVEGWD